MAMSLFATSAFAQLQEVRGIETRRVIYEGPMQEVIGFGDNGSSNKYYGFEFKNMNSISVSVDIELWWDGEVLETKSITLKPKEKYILKFENRTVSLVENNKYHMSDDISKYSVKYKAYKLQ